MKTKNEILNEAAQDKNGALSEYLLMEILLDIRDQLSLVAERVKDI